MAEIRVGKPDVEARRLGAHEGGAAGQRPRQLEKQAGHHDDGTADARRSTGIGPKKHDPILPIMPNRPPG